MCLIIHQPKGLTLPRDRLITIGEKNRHGFGWAMAYKGAVHFDRWIPESPESVADWYAEHLAGAACVMHWRFATSGPRTPDMAHPFPLAVHDDRAAPAVLFHNGVVKGGTATESDTAALVRTLIRPVTRDGLDLSTLDDPAFATLFEGLILGSAIVVLDGEGKIRRWGNHGFTHDGAWYSNRYVWAPPAPAPKYPDQAFCDDATVPTVFLSDYKELPGRASFAGYNSNGRAVWRAEGQRYIMCTSLSSVNKPMTEPAKPVASSQVEAFAAPAHVEIKTRPLPKGSTRLAKAKAKQVYWMVGVETERTPEEITDDHTLATLATKPGRLTVADLETIDEIKARREARLSVAEKARADAGAALADAFQPVVAPAPDRPATRPGPTLADLPDGLTLRDRDILSGVYAMSDEDWIG